MKTCSVCNSGMTAHVTTGPTMGVVISIRDGMPSSVQVPAIGAIYPKN